VPGINSYLPKYIQYYTTGKIGDLTVVNFNFKTFFLALQTFIRSFLHSKILVIYLTSIEQNKEVEIMAKIEVKNFYKIFGNKPQKALEMFQQGSSKEDILSKTGQTVGIN